MLEIRGLSYHVNDDAGEKDILNGVDLEVEDGTFLVITGPNGGGKTTLAKAIMGLVQPTAGSILYQGTELMGLGVTERARLGICYGFQQPPRFKGLQVTELLSIAAGRKLSANECCSYLTKVGLCTEDYVDREIDASLSGGEVKRIEIASLLARNASLMIFDEPEAGIDLWSFTRLTQTFESLHKRLDSTMIVISHQERIIRLADEVVLVSEGRIAARGCFDEVMPLLDMEDAACSLKEAE
ncbi:MAG: ATP-binding cassette domain-containing protein [Oscillospiraceae bacterium]|nr:ATP-binding cassette domain-containing protein [Oscillospiraceae bacterium]